MADSDSTTPGKSPAFQFYPKDFLTDENVHVMSLQERGAYITLICLCWLEGTLPRDMGRLSRLCGVTLAVFRRLWPALEVCFQIHAERADRLIHPRLERERISQAEFRRRQSDNGKRGGRPRKPEEPKPLSGLTQTEPKKSSPSPISDLQSPKEQDRAREFPKAVVRPGDEPFDSFDDAPDDPNDPAVRANAFIERYKALHVRLRRGAHYVGKPHFDFQEALQLVQVFDDPTLDKLAYVWLKTDHQFAENGTRTLAKFRSMATWCQEQLIEWEQKHGRELVVSA